MQRAHDAVDRRRAIDQFEVVRRMVARERPTRVGEVERARAALLELDGRYPAEAIAAEIVDCLVNRRLP